MFDHSITILNELVTLEPMYLDCRIFDHLMQKLRKSRVGLCTKEYGFIKDIEIKNVQPAEISMANGATRFSTTYAIKSLLPKSGKIYTSKNILVFNHQSMRCVIATIDDTCDKPFQIFITNGTILGKTYKFNDCNCTVPVTLQPMDFSLSDVVIDKVEYHEQKFIITGKHIHQTKPSKDDKKDSSNTEVNKKA